jgi:hypothetical protein
MMASGRAGEADIVVAQETTRERNECGGRDWTRAEGQAWRFRGLLFHRARVGSMGCIAEQSGWLCSCGDSAIGVAGWMRRWRRIIAWMDA